MMHPGSLLVGDGRLPDDKVVDDFDAPDMLIYTGFHVKLPFADEEALRAGTPVNRFHADRKGTQNVRLQVGKKIEDQLLPQTDLQPRPPLAIDCTCKVDGTDDQKTTRTWLLSQTPAGGGSSKEKFVLIKREMLALVRCSACRPARCTRC